MKEKRILLGNKEEEIRVKLLKDGLPSWNSKDMVKINEAYKSRELFFGRPQERWGYGHPTRCLRLLERISRFQWISPGKVIYIMNWYSKKWDYEFRMLDQHMPNRTYSFRRFGMPKPIGYCSICVKPIFHESYTCQNYNCTQSYGWWLHTRTILPRFLMVERSWRDHPTHGMGKRGVFILLMFLKHLSNRKRYKRGRKNGKRKRNGKGNGSYKQWSQKCLV